jgi:hypothetical protein
MPVLTFADYWRCRRCQTVTHSPTTGRPPGQCAGKAPGTTSYGTCTNPMDSDDWDAITNEAVLPRVPEPDLLKALDERINACCRVKVHLRGRWCSLATCWKSCGPLVPGPRRRQS